MPDRIRLPVPLEIKLVPPITPDRLSTPAELILTVVVDRLILPLTVAAPESNWSAPEALSPEPLRFSASVMVIPLATRRLAPLLTVTPLIVVPNALLWATVNIP
ncbi:hypothetical protein D3C85_993030 [compost metagenome]